MPPSRDGQDLEREEVDARVGSADGRCRPWSTMTCHRFLLALVKRLTMEGSGAHGTRRKKKSGDESPHSKSHGWHSDCLPPQKNQGGA